MPSLVVLELCKHDIVYTLFEIELIIIIFYSKGNGRVVLTVPYEFEVTLTLVGDDLSLPWRVLDLKILVGHALSGTLSRLRLTVVMVTL